MYLEVLLREGWVLETFYDDQAPQGCKFAALASFGSNVMAYRGEGPTLRKAVTSAVDLARESGEGKVATKAVVNAFAIEDDCDADD